MFSVGQSWYERRPTLPKIHHRDCRTHFWSKCHNKANDLWQVLIDLQNGWKDDLTDFKQCIRCNSSRFYCYLFGRCVRQGGYVLKELLCHWALFLLSGNLTAKTTDSGRYIPTGKRLFYSLGHWHVVCGFSCCVCRQELLTFSRCVVTVSLNIFKAIALVLFH